MEFDIWIIIIFLIQIRIFKTKKPLRTNTLKLYLYEGYHIEKEFELTLSKYSHHKFSTHHFVRGKLCYLDKFSNLNILDNYYHSYYKVWIFLIDNNDEIFDFLNEIKIKHSKYYTTTIIIPSSLHLNFTDKNVKVPLFEIQDKLFHILKTYDIKLERSNYFFVINYGKKQVKRPISYPVKMSFVSIILSLSILIVWMIRYKKISTDNNQCLLAKNVAIFPILKIIISIIMYVKIKHLEKKGSLINSKKTHSHFILMILSLVFKTLLWFFVLFISNGWELTFSIIDKAQLKKIFRKYIIIYFTFCIDEAIDNIVHFQGLNVRSPITNFLVFSQ